MLCYDQIMNTFLFPVSQKKSFLKSAPLFAGEFLVLVVNNLCKIVKVEVFVSRCKSMCYAPAHQQISGLTLYLLFDKQKSQH